MLLNPIQRVSMNNLSIEKFYSEYLLASKPIIITDSMNEWPALTKWNGDYLKNTITEGNERLRIAVSENRMFPSNPEDGWESSKFIKMNFKNYIELIDSDQKLDKTYYIQYNSRLDIPDSLRKDFITPEYIKKENVLTKVWIGSGGNITPIHYDYMSNLFTQIRGKKRVVLFAPSEGKYLYKDVLKGKEINLSPVNLLEPDYEKYPLIKRTNGYECVLNEGEMLFIPLLWWHWVETISDNMTISVNFWWNGPRRLWFNRIGIKTLSFIGYRKITRMKNARARKKKNLT